MANADLDELLAAVLPFAHKLLSADGGFFPFAATMDAEGSMAAKSYELDEAEAQPERVLYALMESVREETAEAEMRAVALCWDARIQAGENDDAEELTDAVAVALEHVGGEALEVFIPYGPGTDADGELAITFGEAMAAERRPSLFAGTDLDEDGFGFQVEEREDDGPDDG
ncbi:MAG: hypothetical protein DHS20C15_33930 [Planctomycetota bacterium]|nr:MAG: hypothetical protein DHS20C15_33930 [Planctomycetota bacterium]